MTRVNSLHQRAIFELNTVQLYSVFLSIRLVECGHASTIWQREREIGIRSETLPPKHQSNWVTSFPQTYQDTAIREERRINRFRDSTSIAHSYFLLFIITFTTQGPWRHKIL